MARLEELAKGVVVEGVEPDGPVTVVNVEWIGEDSVELFYKDSSSKPGSTYLYRFNESMLRLVGAREEGNFGGDGRSFRLAAEAKRIQMAYLFDPLLAVHTSLVDPYPHQISAVYERMLTRQPLRFLLADDPGAGKTIMAGLLMKELVARGDLERCLVCCPGSLVEQWQDELGQKFGLPFEIVAREQIEASRTGNPFAEQNMVICRLDHLSRNEHVQEILGETEWDLIVVDEAHKMSATFSGGEIDKTKRYRLGELFSGLTRHFLLLTATPHSGKEEDFQNALRRELPGALGVMIRENIAPVDLAQSAIGSEMAIYSRYSQVLENDGSPLRIRTALQLINQQLDAVLSE
jgi:SNF2 family DNA or RNA helicase